MNTLLEGASAQPSYGSDLIVDLIRNLGIPFAVCNPGASFRGLHDSVVNYGGNSVPELIECCHEEVSVAIAHGYAKATGKPLVVPIHSNVGLMHASMAIFNAWCDRVPMILLGGVGPMDLMSRRPWIDFIHTSLVQGCLVREFVKWDDQPYTIEAIPESFLRGYKVAMTEPQGPVYICYDFNLQEQLLEGALPNLPNQPHQLATPIYPDPSALNKVARLLIEAHSPVILADYVGRSETAFKGLVELAELLAVPVIEPMNRENTLGFPTNHDLCLMGAEKEILAEADVVVAFNMDDLFGALHLDEGDGLKSMTSLSAKIIDIGNIELERHSWATTYQRYQAKELSIKADVCLAIPALVKVCREIMGGERQAWRLERRRFLGEKHRALRNAWVNEALASSNAPQITRSFLTLQVWEAIKNEDWVLANGSLRPWVRRIWDFTKTDQWLGTSGGAGLGYGIGASLGASLAYRGTNKLVINLQADGDFLFTPEALWTAAHHRLPALVIMDNNRSYFNSEKHQLEVAKMRNRSQVNSAIGTKLDDPPIDFAGLARSFGICGEGPITDPAEVKPAIERALKFVKNQGRMAFVDVVTATPK